MTYVSISDVCQVMYKYDMYKYMYKYDMCQCK